MARVSIPITVMTGSKNPLNAGTEVTSVAFDATNHHQWEFRNGDILCVWNAGSGASRTATVVAVADPTGRTENAACVCEDSKLLPIGPLNDVGWVQTTGVVHVDVSATHASCHLFVLRKPAVA